MSKMEDAQRKAKKVLESMERNGASYTEVNVDTHSEQTVNGETATSDVNVSATSDQADQVSELTADLQRLQAEFANYKRRTESEKAEVADYIKARVVREFLATRDSFDQEQAHRPKTVDPKWAVSIDAIRAQFDKSMSNLGVERFESVGQPFDPHLHEAISMEGGDEVVTEELQAGYKLGDTILRHAMVKVGPADRPKA
jgi:molecular chaperone GrpE